MFKIVDYVEIAYLQQFFTMLTLIFLKNNISLEHLNLLLRIFFVSGVFQNFDVYFWPLLKAEKLLPRSNFTGFLFFSFNIIFSIIHFQPAGLLKIALIVTPLLLSIIIGFKLKWSNYKCHVI